METDLKQHYSEILGLSGGWEVTSVELRPEKLTVRVNLHQ